MEEWKDALSSVLLLRKDLRLASLTYILDLNVSWPLYGKATNVTKRTEYKDQNGVKWNRLHGHSGLLGRTERRLIRSHILLVDDHQGP